MQHQVKVLISDPSGVVGMLALFLQCPDIRSLFLSPEVGWGATEVVAPPSQDHAVALDVPKSRLLASGSHDCIFSSLILDLSVCLNTLQTALPSVAGCCVWQSRHPHPPPPRADREIRQASALLWLPFEVTPRSNVEGFGPSFGISMPESVWAFLSCYSALPQRHRSFCSTAPS